MTTLQRLQKLSESHCVLLAAQYATEANIPALRALAALQETNLPLEIILSVLLTYLPEETAPSSYLEFLNELAKDSRTTGDNPSAAIDLTSVQDWSNARAKKRRQALDLITIVHPWYAVESELDIISHFLIHRAHRIDSQTGLLDSISQLIVPFLSHSEYLRTWFISTVLPLVRLSYEYYPGGATLSLDEFTQLKGGHAINYQLSHVGCTSGTDTNLIARDLRGVVSPWMCGAVDRKRRKLTNPAHVASDDLNADQEINDWDHFFQWMLRKSKDDLAIVTAAITGWDGPEDMDLGGYEEGRDYVDDQQQRGLELKYARTALACIFLIEKCDLFSLQTAHTLLKRLCELFGYDMPLDLDTAATSLPIYSSNHTVSQTTGIHLLREENLLEQDNCITRPGQESIRFIEFILVSAHILSALQYTCSVRQVAGMSLGGDATEQLSVLQKILYRLYSGSKRNDGQWISIRSNLLWLWNWSAEKHELDQKGQGIFGALERKTLETEIVKALLESGHHLVAIQLYIEPASGKPPLPFADLEDVVLMSVMFHYDNASNGNRTRGGMKRVADIVATFTPYFSSSTRLRRIQALLTATHAMSYYSLTIQHGVPLSPVNIRLDSKPLSLIGKLLAQNRGSYTKLDDLISIGQNLVIAMPSTIMGEDMEPKELDASEAESRKKAAEQRVISMAVEAALEEDDFETAYSYVVTRLTPYTPTSARRSSFSYSTLDSEKDVNQREEEDDDDVEDIAWRAALRAGRYEPSSPSSHSRVQVGAIAQTDLRRLEQRMELLSQALLLAPSNRLEEVLVVWQQCEAEMTDLLARESEAETRFNDAASKKVPGAFHLDPTTVQPVRREFGRGAVEEAPMGLFDVARGAAAAFSKSAFPLRGSATASKSAGQVNNRASMDLSDSGSVSGHDERVVRKRDMVATAATGALASGSEALASGLGWVLGTKPMTERGRENEYG